MMQNVIVDLVVRWSSELNEEKNTKIEPIGKIYRLRPDRPPEFTFYVPTVDGKMIPFYVPLTGTPMPYMSNDGQPINGKIAWGLIKLGPSVWKIRPSLNHPDLHAFLTLIEVPEPAPWEG